jgi:hypothetical protein
MSLPGVLGRPMHDGICEPFWQRTVSRLMHRPALSKIGETK